MSCIGSFFDSILLFYTKFAFIWYVTLYGLIQKLGFHILSHRYFFVTVTQKMKILILCKSMECDLSNEREFYKKICQYDSVESSLKMGLIFFHFEDYSKSAWWMILFWQVTCCHTPTLHKKVEKPTVMWFFTQILFESTVR